MPIPCSFYESSSIVKFKVRDGDTSGNLFDIQDFFSYPLSLSSHSLSACVFPHEVKSCSRSVKNCVGILMRAALNL